MRAPEATKSRIEALLMSSKVDAVAPEPEATKSRIEALLMSSNLDAVFAPEPVRVLSTGETIPNAPRGAVLKSPPPPAGRPPRAGAAGACCFALKADAGICGAPRPGPKPPPKSTDPRSTSTLSHRSRPLGAKGFTFVGGGGAGAPDAAPKRTGDPRPPPKSDLPSLGIRSENPQSSFESSDWPSPMSPSLSQMSVFVDAIDVGVPLTRGVPSLFRFNGRLADGDAIIASLESSIVIDPNPSFACG